MKPLTLALLLAAAALADTTRPQLVSSTPAQGQDSVPPYTQIALVFSKPMDASSFSSAGAIALRNLSSGYNEGVFVGAVSSDGTSISLRPGNSSLSPGTAYQLELNAAVLKDRSGNLLVPVAPIRFDTFLNPDKSGPHLTGTVPADGETGVAVNTGMYVVFDKPIAALAYDAGIAVSTAAGPLQFTLSVAGDRVLQILTPLMLPANQQVTVSVSGIVDRTGVALATPVVFSFQTGVLPDTQAQSLRLTPPTGTPISLPMNIAFAKPADPALMATGSVTFQSYYQYSSGDTYPATFTLAGDRRGLTVNAAQLQPGDYTVHVSIPFDRTAGKLNAFSFNVTVGASADPTPAQLLFASPPDGSLDVPVSATIRVAYTKPVDIAGSPAAISVTANGNPVAGTVTVDYTGAILKFTPQSSLQPSTAYSVSVSGLNDLAGNAVAPYTAAFTTRASGSTYADTFKVLSVDPPSGATGVDPSSPVTVTFSHPVDPVSLDSSNPPTVRDSNGSVPGDFSVNGAVLVFRPKSPMANGQVTANISGVTDLSGATAAGFSTLFTVAGGQQDTTRPTVLSVSPGDGGSVLYSSAHVEIQFSKPMNTATLTAALPSTSQTLKNFTAFSDGLATVSLKATVVSNTRVALEFSAQPGATITLVASDNIADYAGNALVPFRTTVVASAKPASGAAYLMRQVPYNQTMSAPIDAGFTTYWSAPLDRPSVEQNLLVYSTDGVIPGSLQWTADLRSFAFVPATPFRASMTIGAALMSPAHDAAGLPIAFSTSFGTAYSSGTSASGTLGITGSSLPLGVAVPLNSVIDVQFNQDLTDSFLATVSATLGTYAQTGVSCPFVKVRPRVLRFTPSVSMVAGTSYSLTLNAGTLKWDTYFTPGNTRASSSPAVLAAGPLAGDVAQNSGIRILFTEPVSTLGMPGGVSLLANGVAMPLQYTWTGGQGLSLQPVPFLQPATDYTVAVSGFENLAGIPVPDRIWTFHTGSAIDTTPPSVVRIQPSGSNVGLDAVVSFTFDKPIAPDSAAPQAGIVDKSAAPYGGLLVPATAGFSDDLRTLFLRPNSPLAAGDSFSASLQSALDFAGNAAALTSLGSTTFDTGYGGTALSTVTGTSPPPGAAGVPINATIQIQSSTNLPLLSGISATVAENGNPLPASLRLGGDGRTVTVVPARPLDASSAIDVTVAGIASDPYHFSFSTGTNPDRQAPTYRMWPVSGLSPVPASVAVSIRFNKPMNPLSVNTSNVTLSAPDHASVDASVALDASCQVVTLTPKYPLAEGEQYTVAWSAVDLAGNQASSSTTFTVGQPDNVPAALLGIDPVNGATGVSTSPPIQAFFNKPVDLPLGDDSFRLLLNGVRVPGSVTSSWSQLTFSPTYALQPGATYTIVLTGAVDAFGNVVPDATSSFTVYSAGDAVKQLALVSAVPASGAVGVPADAAIRLTFNEQITTASALSFTARVGYSSNSLIAVHVEGNDLVIQPTVPFTGGTQVSVNGTARDSAGTSRSVTLYFTVTPVPGTTPPVLEYQFPAPGATVPTFGTTMVLRFSEPVIAGQNAIRVIGGSDTTSPGWSIAADGRTLASSPTLTPSSDVTIAITAGLTDLAGNPIVPVSYQLHVLSADLSNMPKVKSIAPPAGATGVPVDATIQLQFTHVMDPVSTAAGFHATAAGVPITGTLALAPDGLSLQFTPDLPFTKGTQVTVVLGSPAEDVTGQELSAISSTFTVVKDSAALAPAPIALSASATAVDVRFDAPLDRYRPAPYLRAGSTLVPSHWELRGEDGLRIVPDEPLQPGRAYRLVLDARTEFPLRLAANAAEPALASAVYDGATLRLRFDGEINPLTVDSRTVRLTAPDGAAVAYYAETSLDGREIVLRPATAAAQFTVTLDGLESAGGTAVRGQSHRLARAPR